LRAGGSIREKPDFAARLLTRQPIEAFFRPILMVMRASRPAWTFLKEEQRDPIESRHL
jgi:hypothetical protein